MKFNKFFILLFLLVLNKAAYAGSWNFAVLGDTRSNSSDPGVNTDAVTAIATDIVNNRNCAFVLHVGDLVYGTTAGTLDTQFDNFSNAVTAAGLKLAGSSGSGLSYYPIRGNHDDSGSTDTAASWRNHFTTLPQNGPTDEAGLTYSFTYENALVLGVDEYIGTDHTVNNQTWVDQQLTGTTRHAIAFGHDPAYRANHSDCLADNVSSRDAFLTSLYNADGRLYFSGHDHFTALARVYEKAPGSGGTQGFYQIIIGGGGAPNHTFNGVYNTGSHSGDYSATDLYHDSDTTAGHVVPFHYAYAVVTINNDLLWLKIYGTESLTTISWQLLYALVISGTLETDTTTLTSNAANDSAIIFDQSFDGTYSGIISGSGSLTKNGTGALTLSGNNTYSGATTVNAGTLNVTGSSSSTPVTVNSGATLQGAGTIKSLTNYGTVKPGNSVGTLNLNGDAFTQGASGRLEIEVESTSSYDKIIGASTASLNGTLRTTTTGSYTIGDTLSGIIRTSGGITGAFSFLDTQITPTIVWKSQVNGNNLDLIATRDYNNDALRATLTPNQKNVAAEMQAVLPSATGDLATVKSAIDSLNTNAQVADAYSQVSAEKFSGIPSIAFSNAAAQFNHLQSQMRILRTGKENGTAFQRRGETSKTLLAYEGDDWGKFILKPNDKTQKDVVNQPPSQEPKEKLSREEVIENTLNKASTKREEIIEDTLKNLNKIFFGFFINSESNYGRQDPTDMQPGFHYYTNGLNAGLYYRFRKNFIGGLHSGYARTDSDLGGSGGKVDVDSVFGGAYGTYYNNNFYVEGASNFSCNFYDTARNINFGGLDRKVEGDTTGLQCNLFLGTGYDFQPRHLTIGPNLTAKYSKLWIDSFSESGAGSLDLHITDQRAESFQLGLGWHVEYELKVRKKTVVPQAYVSYQHEFYDDGRAIEARLEGGSNKFQVTTDKPTRDFALVSSGITVKLTESVSFDAGYDAQVGQRNYFAQSIYGSMDFSF